MLGTIKKVLNGFGFITPEEGEKDYFFHASDLQGVNFDDLTEGQLVEFDLGPSDRGGEKCVNVTLAQPAA